ncbi:MAG: hypothetical protein ACJ761_03115, partial [Chloroflexota bacterium]
MAQYNCRPLRLHVPGATEPLPAGMGLNTWRSIPITARAASFDQPGRSDDARYRCLDVERLGHGNVGNGQVVGSRR